MILAKSTPAPRGAPRPVRAGRDLAIVALATGLSFFISAALELREWMTEATRPLERYQLDELPLTFAVLAVALAWFAWRRWRQAAEELRLRMSAQNELAQREQRYRMLFMEDLAGNALTDRSGEIVLCNAAMASLLGLSDPAQATGRSLAQFYADRQLWLRHRSILERGQKVEASGLDLVAHDGSALKVIARILPSGTPGPLDGLHVYFANVTELHLMQRELTETLAENRLLSQRYLMLQEEERRSLARELHDELGQCLNAIKLDAVSIRNLNQGRDPEVEANASAIVELSGHVYDVVRGIMQRLRPAALDALGLHDAVAHLLAQWQRRHPTVHCRLDAAGDLTGLGEVVNITVYRLVQECLTNIAKHAAATEVTVSLRRDGVRDLSVAVRDNGRGMDLRSKRSGLGLVGLRERVEALSGHVSLHSSAGQGMEVSASLPVVQEPADRARV
jgi:hypothetical protein